MVRVNPPIPVKHEHKWQPAGMVSEEQTSYSPVSVWDHAVRTVKYAVTTCECGAVRKTLVSVGRYRWLNR